MRFYASSIRNLLFLALVILAIPAASHAQVAISVAIAPPELPVYDQPVCPGDDYIWTPGYWAYADDYYWVPGTWVVAPEVGFLWTPPYWGWEGGAYLFHGGYWGAHIGFYGGINYGFGYFGTGFAGGRWDGGHFFYNRSVTNVNVNIRNVYNTRVDVRNVNRVSFNGGRGGVDARATSEEEAAARERHVGPVAAQEQHRDAARSDPQQRFATNHGRPAVAATSRAGEFKGEGVAASREGEKGNDAGRAATPGHVKDLPAAEHPAPVKTGDAKTDQRNQQQQDKLNARQDQERQKLQQKQDQDHQRMDQQKTNDARRQQTEQRHQQQTQQMVQRHSDQQRQMQQRQSRPSGGDRRR